MSEYEISALFNEMASSSFYRMEILVTVSVAFLVAAYLIADKLQRSAFIVFVALYCLFGIQIISGMNGLLGRFDSVSETVGEMMQGSATLTPITRSIAESAEMLNWLGPLVTGIYIIFVLGVVWFAVQRHLGKLTV